MSERRGKVEKELREKMDYLKELSKKKIKKEVDKILRKLIVVPLIVALCLIGATALVYQEAPMLRVKVAAGELPSVEERLPEEPAILKVPEIGQLGGTIHTFVTNMFAMGDMHGSASAIGVKALKPSSVLALSPIFG